VYTADDIFTSPQVEARRILLDIEDTDVETNKLPRNHANLQPPNWASTLEKSRQRFLRKPPKNIKQATRRRRYYSANSLA
jgi:hypothetical protein